MYDLFKNIKFEGILNSLTFAFTGIYVPEMLSVIKVFS